MILCTADRRLHAISLLTNPCYLTLTHLRYTPPYNLYYL